MAEATIIDGKGFAGELRAKVAEQVHALRKDHDIVPGLAVVLVGEDPASQIYVRNKGKLTAEVGMKSFEHLLPADTSQKQLLTLIEGLNGDPEVHGILVQLPLPDQIDEQSVLAAVEPAMVPCTPVGCVMLIKDQLGEDLSGKKALIVGRSNIVGKPMAALLLRENCTVTMAHSRTLALDEECRAADILVAAVGRAKMIKGDWIKPGAVVIDVGMNRSEPNAEGKTKLAGDVDFEQAKEVAGAITPVPGGVGPMTIACLLQNTIWAACRQAEIEVPQV